MRSPSRFGPDHRRLARTVVVGLVLLLAAGPVAIAGEEGTVTGTVRISPLAVNLELGATSVQLGKPVQARATVSNVGVPAIRRVVVELRLDPVGLVRRPLRARAIHRLRGGQSGTASWSVCGVAPGSYVVLAQATADGVTAESAARLLTVTPGGPRSC